ncbi:MAG: ubiquinol-cytochrome C chaperone family protein, partial [Aestuariivirga sp.]|nr:ubiquinol-cytochrome C chaperone family protein [Aestuariivirga sp.]
VAVGKKVRKIAESYYGRVTAYNRALSTGPKMLEEAISRNIYPDGASEDTIRVMAAYFGDAAKLLGAISLEQILLGELRFP